MIHNLSYYSHIPWFTKQHIFDWALCAVIFIIESAVFNFAIQPYDRYLPDGLATFQQIQYPVRADIVPTWLLMVIAFAVPIAVFGAVFAYYKNSNDFHHACLGLIQAFTMTMLFTDFLKVAAGRYRPSYAGRVETGRESFIRDGRLSFPSGHSSVSFASMTFLSMYLCGKLKIFRKSGSPSWKLFIALSPFVVSSLVAVSRTMDYHHDFSDILGGTLIGLCFGSFIYSNNFNSLYSRECALPKNRLNPHYANNGLLFATDKDDESITINVM
ncbi:hypothetical protein SAMD00019534_045760, partial [Acytostelium subglobosum LB1]|uniref:hypothetical protein n=1 Tax=Acytostelium subglobosum LB1 TaxID=1410327 RepID=UPI000644C8B5